MTRFARAKGSKSSNEKLPEDGTPWSQMKKGLLMNQQKEIQESFTSYNENSKKEVKPSEWCNLDDINEDCLDLLKSHLKKNVIKKKLENSVDPVEEESIVNEECPEVDGDPSPRKKKKKMKKSINLSSGINSLESKSEEIKEHSAKDETGEECTSSVKMKKRKRSKKELMDNTAAENVLAAKKMKIRKSESQGKVEDEKDELEILSTASEIKDVKKSKKKETIGMGRKNSQKFAQKYNQGEHFKKKLKHEGNKFTTKINIGGEMVTLMKYQGYYVMKDDAKRLKEMKRKMLEEGIPESQTESVIKLERRKCEKSLARMKKNVCFQCRKPGHVLSQCQELQNKSETGTGICYKCGSTEHKAFTCKVMHKQKYPFAECFICKEKGHIARECPDNPRGLYPNGGCCKLCGDVTHMKKDCPTKILESEEKTVKVGVRDDRNVEGLDEIVEKRETRARKEQKKKLVTY